MKRILVPTDFSETARWASEAAIDIAGRTGADVIFLHVVELPASQSYNVQGEVDATAGIEERIFILNMIEKGKKELERWVAEFSLDNVSVLSLIRLGNPYYGIADAILSQQVDLVIIGATGRTRVEKIVLGSTTERVMRNSKCAVLTIHQKPSGRQFKNIVYATSLEPCESSFAEVVKAAQDVYNSTVHLVKINTPSNFSPDYRTRPMLEAFVERVRLKDYTINIFNDDTAEDGIIHFADSINADLIGLATHNRSWFTNLFSHSTPGEVNSHSSRPVLTFVTNIQAG